MYGYLQILTQYGKMVPNAVKEVKTMQNWSQIAHKGKDILTVCLAKGIDQALSVRLGNGWFANFAQEDAKEKINTRITKPGQQSVQDMDLQALLKLLRYRGQLTQLILSHYDFFAGLDSFSTDGQLQQLNNLLDRLINDFRNRIEAHARASDIEKELSGEGMNRIYGYEEAYQDMYKLTRIFANVTDSNGVSYARHMASLTKKKRRWPISVGIGAAVLALVIGLSVLVQPWKNNNVYRGEQTPKIIENELSIQPIKVYYDNGEMVAVCYLVNGTDRQVSHIDVSRFCLTENGRNLAAASFAVLEGVTIDPGKSVKWQFRFPRETVFVDNGKLPELEVDFYCKYQ